MNSPFPIIGAHFDTPIEDATDLVFARLGGLAADVGGSLETISRLCGKPDILHLLRELDCMHRAPDVDDSVVIEQALRLLGDLHDVLSGIPTDPPFVSVVRDEDRTLVSHFDAAVRYSGARVADQLQALERLRC